MSAVTQSGPADPRAPETGDVLTHPVHGPVRIASISTRQVRGESRDYVDLEVIGEDMRISVPAGGRQDIGLRELLPEQEIADLLEQLALPVEPKKKQSWAHRIKSLTMQLQSGRISDRIAVIRDILGGTGDKPLSLAERNLLRSAITPLAAEMAIVREMTVDEAHQMLLETAERGVRAGGDVPAA